MKIKLNKKDCFSTNIKGKHFCRVCGFHWKNPPWGENGDFASFDMCLCCGVTAGYQDCCLEAARDFRREWLENGAKWNSPEYKPENWSLEKQLKNIPEEFL